MKKVLNPTNITKVKSMYMKNQQTPPIFEIRKKLLILQLEEVTLVGLIVKTNEYPF